MNLVSTSPKIALRIAGAGALLLGLVGLLGARAETLGEFRILHGWVPAHCSLAFVVAGVGLGTAGFSLRLLCQLCGISVLILAVELWAEEKGWLPARVGSLWSYEYLSPYAHHIGVHTFLCFAILGIALIILGLRPGKRSRGLVLALFAGFILSLPVAEMLGLTFNVSPPTSEGFWAVTLFTAPAHALVGWALLVFAWHDTPQELRNRTYWPPLLMNVAVLSSTMLLWQALVSEEYAQIDELVADRTEVVRSEIETGISRRIQPLFALAQQADAPVDRTHFIGLVKADFAVDVMEAIDQRGRSTWRITSMPGEAVDRLSGAALLPAVRERKEPTLIPIRDEEQQRFAIAIPRRADSGFLFVFYSLKEFLSDALHWPMMTGYGVELFENGAPVYQLENGELDSSRARELRIPLYGSEWRLRVVPTRQTVEAARSGLPRVVLFAGFLLMLVLVWVHRLGYQTKLRARDLGEEVKRRQQAEVTLQRLNEELEQRVTARTGELRAVNTALAHEKERWAITLHSIADAVITTDASGKITSLNSVAEKLTGWHAADAIGQQASQVFDIRDASTGERASDPIAAALSSGSPATLPRRTVLRPRDGNERLVADSAAPVLDRGGNLLGAVLVFRDITETQKMEDELFKAKNLESIGLLAGGIAHDFNNILTAILGNIGLAKLYAKQGDPVFEILSEAEKGFARARDLTMQLLTFSRGGAPVRTTASVEELLRETSTFALRGSNVRYDLHIAPDLWPASIDPGQISQAINNLLLNAKQAMPHGGVIMIATENVVVTESDGPVRLGPFIKITITDQGTGIAPDHLARIFDPYFTTKAGGTGLGLATTYSIVKRHQGHIEAESTVGVGTTFRLYLPAAPAGARVATERSEDAATSPGEGRVLVMDDEASIRDIAARSLSMLGYEVSVAASGEEAIEAYRRALAEDRRYDAVILDLTVPGGMGGEACVKQLRAMDPQVHAIVSSGYSNDPIVADFSSHGFDAMVAKPYDMRALAAAVREATLKFR